MLKFQGLLIILSIALTLYAFIDCAQKEDTAVRALPKWGWLLVILFVQPIGSIGYLIAGRPKGPRGPRSPKRRVLPPDDDPDFLRKL
jgi:hypothetical protein